MAGKYLLMALLLVSASITLRSQAIDPQRSAKAEVMNDARFIDSSIEYNEDLIFLSQNARERATDAKVKELAAQIEENNSGMLYSMQQLENAGAGVSKKTRVNNPDRKAIHINDKLSKVSGGTYDTLWVSELMELHQRRYEQLSAARGSVRNPQLKMAITEALGPVKKDLTQLKALQKYFVRLEIQRKKEEAARLKEEAANEKLRKR